MTISDELDCSVALDFDWEGQLLKDLILSYFRLVTASYTLGLRIAMHKGIVLEGISMYKFILFLYFQHCPTLMIINASAIDAC